MLSHPEKPLNKIEELRQQKQIAESDAEPQDAQLLESIVSETD